MISGVVRAVDREEATLADRVAAPTLCAEHLHAAIIVSRDLCLVSTSVTVNTQQGTLLPTRSTKLVLRTRRRTVLNAVDLDCLYFETTLTDCVSNKEHVSMNHS